MTCRSLQRRRSIRWLAISLVVPIVACSSGGKSASQAPALTTSSVRSFDIVLSTSAPPAGTTVTVTSRAQFVDGTTRDVTAQTTWSASSGALVSFPSPGTLVALAPGSTDVIATYSGATASKALVIGPANVLSLAVEPASATIASTTIQQLRAVAILSTGKADVSSTAQWISSNGAVASVDARGAVTGVAAGTATLTVSYGGKQASATVSVTASALQAISITAPGGASGGSVSLPLGFDLTLQVTGSFADGHTQSLADQVTWTSSDGSVATVVDGVVHPVGPGTAVISATRDGITTTITVVVTPATLASVVILPATTTLANGTGLQLQASGIFDDGTSIDISSQVAWTSSSPGVAEVSNLGFVSARGAGSTTVTATSGALAGSSSVTVSSAVVRDVSITPASTSIPVGGTQQFTATGNLSDGSTVDLTRQVGWSVSGSSVASISSLESAGQATAVGPGTATITATFPGFSPTATLTVTSAAALALSGVAIAPSSTQLGTGDHVQLTAIGTFSNGTTSETRDVTADASWASDSALAVVSNVTGTKGYVTAGTTVGTARITATMPGAAPATATVEVTAAAPPPPPVTLQRIVVSALDGQSSTPAGLAAILVATGWYSSGDASTLTASDVTWASDNPAVATISPDGILTPAPGVTTGTTNIVATSTDGKVVSAPLPFGVTNAVLTAIQLDPGLSTIAVGTTARLTVTGLYSDGSALDITAAVAEGAWSYDPTYLTFLLPGLFRGATATAGTPVDATAQCVSGNSSSPCMDPAGASTLIVRPANLLSIKITSSEGNSSVQTLPPAPGVGDQLTAVGTFDDGSTQDLTNDPGLTWASSNPLVASFEGAIPGLLQTGNAGSTTITAKMMGITGSMVVAVTSAKLVGLAITPTAPTVPLLFGIQLQAIGRYDDSSTYTLTEGALWSSSDATKVTVSNTPGMRGTATGVALGTATVQAQVGNYSGSVTVTVTSATLQGVIISTLRGSSQPAPDFSLSVAQKTTLYATGVFNDGSLLDITRQTNWHTAPKSVASVQKARAGAVVTATGTGTTKITARKGSKGSTNSPQLTVTD